MRPDDGLFALHPHWYAPDYGSLSPGAARSDV